MRCKTHIVSANALCLLLFNPTNTKELLIGMSAVTVGGMISDLDVRTSDVHKVIDTVTLLSFTAVLVSYILDLKYNYGIFSTVKNGDYYIPIVGILMFLIVSFYGSHQPHRSFMHSLLGVFLLTSITYSCFGSVWLPFMIGMLSHILLDLLNKKNIRILYPLKRGICFKLCEFGGLVDNIFLYLSIVFVVVKLFVL